MAIIIGDGGGHGNHVHVTSDNMLKSYSVSNTELHYASETNGQSFSYCSDQVSLTTTGSYSGILYLKVHTGTLHIYHMMFSSTVMTQWEVIKNPSTGTLITAGTAKNPVNMRFDSSVGSDVDLLHGADAQTITDGVELFCLAAMGTAMHNSDGAVILAAGDSMGIMCKPGASATVTTTVFASHTSGSHH